MLACAIILTYIIDFAAMISSSLLLQPEDAR